MKLSEYKGEKAIEVFADLLEPISEILSDKEVTNGIQADLPKIVIIRKAMKNHAKAIVKILAILDDENPETYEVNFVTIPIKLMELMNDEALTDLFTSQAQTTEENSSGSATENTEESEH